MKRIIAVVGMPGSGKSLFAQNLGKQEIPIIRFGAFVTSEVERRGQLLTPENERIVREELRAAHGMDVIARLALPNIKDALSTHDNVVIDGLYSFSEYRLLLAEFSDSLFVVAIVARRSLRYHRLGHRPERPLSAPEALSRDIQEIEKLEKGGPIAMADVTVVNDGTAEQLATQAHNLLLDVTKSQQRL